MAASKATQSRCAPVKALSLFGVLALAKLCMVAGRDISPATVPAIFLDDALIAGGFGVMEWLTRRRPVVCTSLYVAVVAYAAFNVPIARLTSSPLTRQMMRATGSALSDSITYHLTATNVALIGAVIVAAVVLPFALRGVPPRTQAVAGALLMLATVFGRSDGRYHRNAFTALIQSAMPRVTARATHADWRAPLSAEVFDDESLEFLRAAGHGRNIVLIALESTGAQYLKPYGAIADPMPNVTSLARRAVLFENAYAVYPESIKGLFSVLCSRYPAFDTTAADYERVRTPAIAEVARRSGYRTALFHSGRFMYLGMRSVINARGFEMLEDAGAISGNHNSSFGVDEPSTVERILEWIDGLRPAEKFCLMYLPIAGHHPYEVPVEGPFGDQNERRRYLNALHYGDAAVGQLICGLKQRGHDTNTLFVIYGDHGEAFGQHDGNFGHTFFLYEENVRVPLLIVAPGLIERPIRIANIASLVDIAPTIAELTDLAAPSDWQGISLLSARPRTALFFTDYSLPLVGVRDGSWKVIFELGAPHNELFNLSRSRDETHNLASGNPFASAYRDRAESWAAGQKSLLKP